MVWRIPILIICIWAGGCGLSRSARPVSVVEAHVDALRRGDLEAARSLLIEAARVRDIPMTPAPSASVAASVERSRSATWQLPGGRSLVLWHDADGWRVRSGVLGFRRCTTPEEAALTLSRAITGRDYELWLALLPSGERRHWTVEALADALGAPATWPAWERLAKQLRTALPAAGWLEAGMRAHMAVGEATIEFVREEDGWKVADVRPHGSFLRDRTP